MDEGASRLGVDDADSPVTAIIEAVAAREGVAPTDLQPHHDVMERLLDGGYAADGQAVRFEYPGYAVTARSGWTVHIEK